MGTSPVVVGDDGVFGESKGADIADGRATHSDVDGLCLAAGSASRRAAIGPVQTPMPAESTELP